MRVLMINTVCGTGSTGRICVDIANGLHVNGNDCLICYGRGEGIGFDNTFRIGSKLSFSMHAVKSRITDKHGLGSSRDTKRLIKKIQEYSPDIIHLHNIHGYYVNYKLLFEFLSAYGKPIIWTLHDCWAFTGHCAYFDYAGCDKWKIDCANCSSKKSYPASKIFSASKSNLRQKKHAFTLPQNMKLVTPSQWLKDIVNQSFLNKYPVDVIHNGIDLSVFKPTESNVRQRYGIENKFMILAVANIWDRRKGIDDILSLAKMLDENEIIVLVGKTLGEIKHDKIIHIERTENVQELASLYTAADVFVNPTYEDNYPTVNLEAQACGTPVITYDTGGSVESVPTENVVKKGDFTTLYMAINRTKSVTKIKAFDKHIMVTSYISIFENLME